MVHVICVALTTVLEGESSVGFAPTGTFHEQCQFPETPLNENLPSTVNVVAARLRIWNLGGATLDILGHEPVVLQEAVLLAVNTQDAVSKQNVQSCLRALVAYASVQEAQSVS
jgi:hypothetical protein